MIAAPPALAAAVNPGDLVTYGPLLIALPVAAAAGLVSFLSPCCLPLAYVTGAAGADAQDANWPVNTPTSGAETSTIARSRRGPSRTMVGTCLFVLGFAAVFTSYGVAVGAVGTVLLEHQVLVTRVLGVFTIGLGLMFAGFLSRIPLAGRAWRAGYRPKVGVAGAPLLGVMFGVGWTPCIGPTLAVVLNLSAADSSATAGRGALLTAVYCAGLGIPFVVAGVAFRRALGAFAAVKRHYGLVIWIGAALLVTVGVLLLTGAWTHLSIQLRGAFPTYTAPC
jgi:cytochrome c-type biogenesis protein